MSHRFIYAKVIAKTIFLYGLLGWVYIAMNAVVHPETLPLPLTHLAPFPREDTFGIICFGCSALAFFIYSLLNEHRA